MLDLIKEATQALQGKIRTTPVEISPKLSKLLGQPIYLKLECLQVTGSFKARGAFYYLSTLSDAEKKAGVATCSAGNHGVAVAYAGKQLGVQCTIFVPKSVDQAKYDKLIELGAHAIKSEFIGYDDTLVWAREEAQKLNIPLISAFDDEMIMAANGGTLAVEVLEQVPDAEHFVLPMGGGGLSAGFTWYVKQRNSNLKTTLCQLENSPALQLSFEQNKPITHMPPIETLAGGIEGGLGEKCFSILKKRVDEIVHIKEDELKEAVRWLLKNHQYLIEPSAAVALASCLFNYTRPLGPTVIVLSGRNVSYATLQKLVGISI
jgi:threonine dehydratase